MSKRPMRTVPDARETICATCMTPRGLHRDIAQAGSHDWRPVPDDWVAVVINMENQRSDITIYAPDKRYEINLAVEDAIRRAFPAARLVFSTFLPGEGTDDGHVTRDGNMVDGFYRWRVERST